MNNRIERIKKHFRDNKKTYIVTGVAVTVSVVTTYFLTRNHVRVQVPQQISMPRILSPGDNHVNIELTYLGHPGDAFQCIEDGTVYMSRGAIARAFGVSRQTVNNSLADNGEKIAGRTFRQLTDRGTPIT